MQVRISENRKLTKVNVPTLRRHEISVEPVNGSKKSTEYVKINRLDDGKAMISYNPNVKKLQRLLNSNHALQFSVKYDVEREGRGGEIEVTI